MKSGEIRESIDLETQIEGRKATYEALSDGQRQKFNLVLTFSIHSLCRALGTASFDTLFLDEVLDLSLDDEAKEFTVELLQLMQREEGIDHIIVISHAPEIMARFERHQILHVTVGEGGSVINEPT